MKGYLLDTNVLSESSRSNPHPAVRQFVSVRQNLWVSVISIDEVQMGVGLMPDGRRRDELADWLATTVVAFEDRLLAIGRREAEWSGKFRARARRSGYQMSHADALIAATAVSRDLCLVTRNIKDFRFLDIAMLNPWDET